MANLIGDSGDASSNLVGGTGTTSAVFTMPGNVALNVESVVASINNGGASEVTPKITVRDQSGVVIATSTQDDAIPAGDTGTATFALRLDKSGGGIRYHKLNTGSWLYVVATGTGGPNAASIQFVAAEDIRLDFTRDIDIEGTPGRDINLSTDNDCNTFVTRDYNVTANRDVNIGSARNTSLDGPTRVNVTGGDLHLDTTKVGFFFAAPVVQQPTPVTLANVIALLQAYGLAA